MKIQPVGIAILLLLLLSGLTFAQDQQSPFTKEEILRLLKPAPGKRDAQGDLAGEIEARGIAFPVDEKTLEELRKAGARAFVIVAIQQAANRPKLLPPPSEDAKEPITVTRPEPPPLTLLDKARQHAETYIDDLPNFIVTQIVSRSVRLPGTKDWQAQDKLEIELTYNEKTGEKFKLLKLNDKPTTQTYDKIGGATSTGEFGSMLAELFAPSTQADFKEVRQEVFNGRQTVLYEFRVKKANSGNHITDRTTGQTVRTGYSGSVWLEAETGRVLRIEQAAEDIQRGFPVTMAESAVEYDWITIAGTKYLLPVNAEMIMGRDADRFYSRNVMELKNYRVFDSDVKIILDKDPPKQ